MSKVIHVVIGVLAVLGAAYVAMLAVAFVGVPGVSHCFSYHVMEVSSPNSAYLATVENSSCSSSNELQTIVYMSGAGLPASTSASVFSAPSAIRDAGSYSPLALKLTWRGDSELEIAYPHGTQLQSRVESAGSVKVVYRELPQP